MTNPDKIQKLLDMQDSLDDLEAVVEEFTDYETLDDYEILEIRAWNMKEIKTILQYNYYMLKEIFDYLNLQD